jgi:Rrf2 family cysteine metabolism transcriptional repressor
MLRISTRSQYGLRAMIYLAKYQDKICPLKVISKKESISFDYLEKIISKLEKAGLIKAKKGVQGGYFLGRSPLKIKIGEIIRVLEGEKGLVKCLAKNYRCPFAEKCLSKKFWGKIQNSLNSTLNSVTLADLIKK